METKEVAVKKQPAKRNKSAYYERQRTVTARNKARRKASAERRKATRPKQARGEGVTDLSGKRNIVRHARRYARRHKKAEQT